jgi:hypothetical protein
MIKPKQVPKQSATAVDDLFEREIMNGGGPTPQEIIAAAINAWPGMSSDRLILTKAGEAVPAIILPIPTEKPAHE